MKALVFKELSVDLPKKKLEELKIHFIGKNGKFTVLLKSLQDLNKSEKANVGKFLNIIKKEIDNKFF